MGNTHSTEAPQRQSHRLSKPNMGNHTTAGLLSPSFSYSTRRFSNARLSAIPPSPTLASSPTSTLSTTFEVPGDLDDLGVERRASAVSTKQSDSKRRSLFRSKSSQRAPDPERRNSLIGSGLRGPDKLDRANSMTYESALSYYGQAAPENWPTAPRSRASWNYDMGSYAAKRLLNLDEEPALEQATTMSENMMSVVSETTWKSSNPANPTSARISRANSDLSLYMPVRRRSVIQTPGVATRSNSTRNSPAPSRPGTFRHSHPPTPNLSRQQSFESYGNGVMSMPPPMTDREYMPRVVTPCEDDYQSIGAYKLGSLRITNGAASPMSPENEMDRKDERLEKSDYFSRTQAPELGDTTSEVAQDHKQPPEVLTKVEAPQPRSVHLSPIAMSFMSLEVTSDVSEAWSKDSAAVTDVPPDYLAEINFAPFSLSVSPPPSPKLETTSKTSAQEAHLFEDETQPEYSSVEVLDVRLDLSAKSQHDQIASGDTSKILERTDSGFVSISSPVIFEQPHKPLTKADSGYSSNVSLQFNAPSYGASSGSTPARASSPAGTAQGSTPEISY
ncbi:hypothetical protein B0T19DRAFT_436974 [Cercophora scortea]|uniref:Uncharacterized protein n=1 Tax=Cercophora scortea TaxID=314031 RepID=A0AAE0J3B6_9PEZI|nr:hypothetical protein B0T19DRAFT_436974 [Cercophora scortea]